MLHSIEEVNQEASSGPDDHPDEGPEAQGGDEDNVDRHAEERDEGGEGDGEGGWDVERPRVG
jgi:hypothetical protein